MPDRRAAVRGAAAAAVADSRARTPGQVAHRASLTAMKAKRCGPVQGGPTGPSAASREVAPLTGTRSGATPRRSPRPSVVMSYPTARPFQRFNVRALATPIPTANGTSMPKSSGAQHRPARGIGPRSGRDAGPLGGGACGGQARVDREPPRGYCTRGSWSGWAAANRRTSITRPHAGARRGDPPGQRRRDFLCRAGRRHNRIAHVGLDPSMALRTPFLPLIWISYGLDDGRGVRDTVGGRKQAGSEMVGEVLA